MTQALTVAEVLERAADLIEPEGAWTQKAGRRDASGQSVLSGASAVCFCALGAILENGGDPVGADDFFGQFVSSNGDTEGAGWFSIGFWNDAPDRTQAEVVAKLREAAALAREQGK